jgi:hypothetical protein
MYRFTESEIMDLGFHPKFEGEKVYWDLTRAMRLGRHLVPTALARLNNGHVTMTLPLLGPDRASGYMHVFTSVTDECGVKAMKDLLGGYRLQKQ